MVWNGSNTSDGVLREDGLHSLYIIQAILYALLTTLSLFADCFCLYILHRARDLNETTRVLIISLVASDLCVGIFGLAPLAWTSSVGGWPEPQHPSCELHMFALQLFQYCGLSAVMLLITECYVAITHPMEYTTIVTRKRTIIIIVMQWTFWVIWGITMYCVFHQDVHFDKHYGLCVLQQSTKKLMFVVIGAIFHIFLPVTVVIVMYTRIWYIARQHVARISARNNVQQDDDTVPWRKRDRKAMYSFLLVTISLTILWIPFTVIEMYETVTSRALPDVVVWIGESLEFSIPWINVFILFFKHRAIKTAARSLPCCQQ